MHKINENHTAPILIKRRNMVLPTLLSFFRVVIDYRLRKKRVFFFILNFLLQ